MVTRSKPRATWVQEKPDLAGPTQAGRGRSRRRNLHLKSAANQSASSARARSSCPTSTIWRARRGAGKVVKKVCCARTGDADGRCDGCSSRVGLGGERPPPSGASAERTMPEAVVWVPSLVRSRSCRFSSDTMPWAAPTAAGQGAAPGHSPGNLLIAVAGRALLSGPSVPGATRHPGRSFYRSTQRCRHVNMTPHAPAVIAGSSVQAPTALVRPVQQRLWSAQTGATAMLTVHIAPRGAPEGGGGGAVHVRGTRVTST